MAKGDKLTPKQQAFIDYYIETNNATKSYKMAGYKANSDIVAGVEGHKLLNKPKIQEEIQKRLKEIGNNRIASAEEVLEMLTETMRDKTLENITARIKAAELIGKRYKLFTDKVEVEGQMEVEINLAFDEEIEEE